VGWLRSDAFLRCLSRGASHRAPHWTDALVELAGLLLIWLVCEIARDSKRLIWYPLFALIGSLGCL